MKQLIVRLLARLFPQFFGTVVPSVDGALSHFNKALEALRNVKEHHDGEASKQSVAATVAQALARAAEAEAVRAARAIAKIEDFIV